MKHFDRYIGPKETECFFLIRNCKKYKKKVYKEGAQSQNLLASTTTKMKGIRIVII